MDKISSFFGISLPGAGPSAPQGGQNPLGAGFNLGSDEYSFSGAEALQGLEGSFVASLDDPQTKALSSEEQKKLAAQEGQEKKAASEGEAAQKQGQVQGEEAAAKNQ